MTERCIPYYRPWSTALLNDALAHAKRDLFLLDVQLGSNCNACCPRCDSSCNARREPADLDVMAVARLTMEMAEERAKLVRGSGSSSGESLTIQGYICGLGEPTAAENRVILKQLLRETNANWAIFTNGIYWDGELTEYLRTGLLAVQVQHDSDDIDQIMYLMGINRRKAELYLKHRQMFYQIAREAQGEDGGTNICGSQVPMQANLQAMPQLTDDIISQGGFPLIAELEEAGNCTG